MKTIDVPKFVEGKFSRDTGEKLLGEIVKASQSQDIIVLDFCNKTVAYTGFWDSTICKLVKKFGFIVLDRIRVINISNGDEKVLHNLLLNSLN